MKLYVKQKLYEFLSDVKTPFYFSGWELQNIIREKTNENTYPSTLLKYSREYAKMCFPIKRTRLTCISKKDSKYCFEKNEDLPLTTI